MVLLICFGPLCTTLRHRARVVALIMAISEKQEGRA